MARAAWLAEHAPPVPGGVEQLYKANWATVLWRCATCEHEWFAACYNRAVNGRGCPGCAASSMEAKREKLESELQAEAKVLCG